MHITQKQPQWLGLLLGAEAPVITPNGVDFSFLLLSTTVALAFGAHKLNIICKQS